MNRQGLNQQPVVAEALLHHIMLKRWVPSKVMGELESLYPIKLDCRKNSGDHLHPRLAIERELCLENVSTRCFKDGCVTADTPVLDCFGNQREVAKRRFHHIHSAQLPVTASDVARWENVDQLRACQHDPLTCNCVVPSVLLLVQTLQYKTPEEWAVRLSQTTGKRGFAIVHRYDGVAGAFYKDEMTWHRTSARTVRCVMDNGAQVYEHDACDWLGRDYYVAELGCVLQSSMVCAHGVTEVWQLSLGVARPGARRAGPLEEWRSSLISSGQSGVFAMPQSFTGVASEALHLDVKVVKVARIALFGSVVVFLYDSPREVVLSVDVVADLTRFCLGKPRTASLYRDLLRNASSHYRAIPNLPPSKIHDCVLFSTLLAFDGQTSVETATLMQAHYDHTNMRSAHADAVAFAPRSSISVKMIASCAASTAVGASIATLSPIAVAPGTLFVAPATLHVVSMIVVATPVAVVTIPPLAVAGMCLSAVSTAYWAWTMVGPLRHENPLAEQWASTFPGEVPPHVPTVVVFAHAPVFKPTNRVKSPGEVKDGASVKIYPVEENEPRAGLELQGISFGVIPTHYASNQASMVSALKNRVTSEVPVAESGMIDKAVTWMESTQEYRDYVDSVKSLKLSLDEEMVRAWAKPRYNAKRVEELVKAFKDLEEKNFTLTRKDKKIKSFVKREKQVSHSFEGNEDDLDEMEAKAPRPIMQHTDFVLLMANPILNVIATARKRASAVKWQKDEIPGVCPAGLSAEEFARWLAEVHDYLGEVVTIDADGSKWDAHMGEDAMHGAARLAVGPVRMQPPQCKQLLLKYGKMSGSSKHGVSFKSREQMATGAPWTGMYNTWMNVAIATYILETGCMTRDPPPRSGLGRNFFIAACGDDMLMLARRQYVNHMVAKCWTENPGSTKLLGEAWKAAGTRLGFSLTLNVGDLMSAEYCSRWMYPTIVNGELLPLPGAKIGRALSRMGFMVDAPAGVTLRSGLIGQLQDNNHVPFVREALKKMLELLPKDGKAGKVPYEDYMMHASRAYDYGPETWGFVTNKYGLTREDLVDFETLLAGVVTLPAAVSWDKLALCLSVE